MMDDIRQLVTIALAFGRVERGVTHPDGRPETDTDHSVSLCWLACSLAGRLYPGLDQGLIAQFAVVHDAPEAYAGDTYAVTVTDGQKEQREREHAALLRIQGELPSLPWLAATVSRYEQQDTPEARFVRAVDKLMPKIVLRVAGNPGEQLRRKGVTLETARQFRIREATAMDEYARDFPAILALREELNDLLRLGDELAV